MIRGYAEASCSPMPTTATFQNSNRDDIGIITTPKATDSTIASLALASYEVNLKLPELNRKKGRGQSRWGAAGHPAEFREHRTPNRAMIHPWNAANSPLVGSSLKMILIHCISSGSSIQATRPPRCQRTAPAAIRSEHHEGEIRRRWTSKPD
jgi:hypothetical protein